MDTATPFEIYLLDLFSQSGPPPSVAAQPPSRPLNLPGCYLQSMTCQHHVYTPQVTYHPTSYQLCLSPSVARPIPNRHISPPVITPYSYLVPSPPALRLTPMGNPPTPDNMYDSRMVSLASLSTHSLKTPHITPVPVMTSTPTTLEKDTSPPPTPGRHSSPPRFFFPTDFQITTLTPPHHSTPASPPLHTPSSFGKATKPRRRSRTKFTPTQLDTLEEQFDNCSYISKERRKVVAAELGITSENIRVWFQNRRCLLKKMQNNRPEK